MNSLLSSDIISPRMIKKHLQNFVQKKFHPVPDPSDSRYYPSIDSIRGHVSRFKKKLYDRSMVVDQQDNNMVTSDNTNSSKI